MTNARTKITASFDLERQCFNEGHVRVAGIDEAGRGPLAGPVAAAAVILDPKRIPKGLADSKTLTAARRLALAEQICEQAIAVSVAFTPAAVIDVINIRQATFDAMRRALAGLAAQVDFALIDGRDTPPGLACPARAIIKGDALSLSIAAASIIAKTARDGLMMQLAKAWPLYGFENHMGYGAPAHLQALRTHGPCALHRLTFAPVRAAQENISRKSARS